MSMLFMMPKLAKLLHIEMSDEETKFFTKLSVNIMNQKREELAKQKDVSKATSFIEFMMIAEQEGKKMEAAEEENDQKKPTKCN